MSPAACCLARRSMRAVSAMVSLIAAMPGGQGCALRAGTGASPNRQLSVTGTACQANPYRNISIT